MTNSIFWFIIACILFFAEGATVNLVSMWFGFGALVAMLVAFAIDNVYIQLIVFVVVSLAMLCLLRPMAKKAMTTIKNGTNVDALVGRIVVLDKPCVNNQKGSAVIGDVTWSVVTENGEEILTAQKAKIVEVRGNKLVVTPLV